MSDPIPMGMDEYNALTPIQQGYVSYMRAAWPGWEIPEDNPYPKGTTEAKMWDEGSLKACLAVIDEEE